MPKSGDDFEFMDLCCNGHLYRAKQYLKKYPIVKMCANYDWAFGNACFGGHLKVCQWLLQVKKTINISANNEDAFRNACCNGHLLLAQWLQSLKPNLYVIHYEEDGSYKDYYIRIKEEALWSQRLIPLWLASDLTPDKNNLLYRIPEDVSRYIISNYL